MSPISAKAVSIGIELETIYNVGKIGPGYSKADFSTYEILEQVSDILSSIIPHLPRQGGILPYQVVVTRDRESGDLLESQKSLAQHCFVVGLDASIDSGDIPEGVGVEISTPAFTNRTWEMAIPMMMQRLKESGRFEFNATTGLHVHIGKGLEDDFSFRELSRVAKGLVLYEQSMSAIHPTRDPSAGYGLLYYRFCGENPVLRDMSTREKIGILDRVEGSKPRLLDCINYDGGKHSTVDEGRNYICNLRSNSKYGTIEFRQAAGTLDHCHTLGWIHTVIRFVLTACATDEARFLEMAAPGGIQTSDYNDFGVPSPEFSRMLASGGSIRCKLF